MKMFQTLGAAVLGASRAPRTRHAFPLRNSRKQLGTAQTFLSGHSAGIRRGCLHLAHRAGLRPVRRHGARLAGLQHAGQVRRRAIARFAGGAIAVCASSGRW